MKNICVLGEDKRSIYVRNLYEKYNVDIEHAQVVITPIPFSRDGINLTSVTSIKVDELVKVLRKNQGTLISGSIKSNLKEKLNSNNIPFYDLMDYEEFNIMNSIATSEGAIKKAIEMTNITLNGSNILILGYGRIGKILASNLSGFGANIYCEARKEKDLALAKVHGYNSINLNNLDKILPDMDIIFNTIPSLIIDRNRIDILKKNVCIIDLASNPGGIDFEYATKKDINTCWYLAIPSKDSPYSAALYVKNIVDNILKEKI